MRQGTKSTPRISTPFVLARVRGSKDDVWVADGPFVHREGRPGENMSTELSKKEVRQLGYSILKGGAIAHQKALNVFCKPVYFQVFYGELKENVAANAAVS